MSKAKRAMQVVDLIVEDLTDRRGLRQEWEAIEDDIQQSIKEIWAEIIEAAL